jgi:hypothetical protein
MEQAAFYRRETELYCGCRKTTQDVVLELSLYSGSQKP